MEDQKTIQEKLMGYQVLQNQLETLSKRRDLLLNKMLEIETTLNTIEEMKDKKDEDVLIPVGSAVYLPGTLKKSEKMIVELGANIAVERDVQQAKNIINERKKNLEGGIKTVETEILKISEELTKLEPEIRNLLQNVQKP